MTQAAGAKALLAPLEAALYHDMAGAAAAGQAVVAPGGTMRLAHPIGTCTGWDGLWQAALGPLAAAWPDVERRVTIRIAGQDDDGAMWVGCCGAYVGTFLAPFLGIPPTRRIAHMRFHEFFRIEAGKVTELQCLWDLPEVMMQAGVWPMAPSLGRDWHVPGPATGDGLGPHQPAHGGPARGHVIAMLQAMSRHPAQGGPEVMEAPRFWHPKMMWYGPAGIGSGRGIDGFRRHHQIPFLRAMPDRGQRDGAVTSHFIAEGDYVGVTGWPNMLQSLTGDGWMGLAPAGQRLELRSLDFWRLENGLIRENWVLVDLLHVYDQLGVDVLARMCELAQ